MKRTYYRLLPFQSLTIYFKCANSTLTQNASIKDNFDKGAFKYSVSAFYYATQHLTLYVCLSVCPKFFFTSSMRSLRWMSSTKATYLLQQENKIYFG